MTSNLSSLLDQSRHKATANSTTRSPIWTRTPRSVFGSSKSSSRSITCRNTA